MPISGEFGPYLTMSSGPRPTAIPSGILILKPFGHNIHGPKIGGAAPFGEVGSLGLLQ